MIQVQLTPRECARLIELCELRLQQYPSPDHMPREEFHTLNALRRLLLAQHTFNKEAADVANETASPEST